ncbi:MAG: CPBP family intramembrane metalloprotease [Oscillospiraceae bacterium]|nr:CPBP family intramembrane metalloprotease [Oscillospiraceae bacterium]
MTNKDTIKRLVIFCLISFVPAVIISEITAHIYGRGYWSNEDTPAYALSLIGLAMMVPAIAHIITRAVTREGFDEKDMYLTMRMRGNIKWYAIAIILPAVYSFAEVLVSAGYNGVMGYMTVDGDTLFDAVIVLLNAAAMSVLLFIPGFGEEFGWRAYMMPKLMKIMPGWAALLTGGVIWGLWHAPLTIHGHNFGTDLPGHPFTGIALMCVMCVLMGTVLTYLTEKTGSVMPAAFMHMMNNDCIGWGTVFFKDVPEGMVSPSAGDYALGMLPLLAAAMVFAVMFLRPSGRVER